MACSTEVDLPASAATEAERMPARHSAGPPGAWPAHCTLGADTRQDATAMHHRTQPGQPRGLGTDTELFRLLVEQVVDYAIFLLTPDGHVASWNHGAERLKGYRPAEIIGESFERFYTEADRAAGRPQLLLNRARA